MNESIRTETLETVRIIHMTGQPQRANPLNTNMMQALLAAIAEADQDSSIRTSVLVGTPQFFSVGSDILEMNDKRAIDWLEREWMDDWDQIRHSKKPIIAAVRGIAMGGGLELALLCDLIVCANDARLSLPETSIGVVPGAGGTQRLISLIGRALTSDMILTGRELSGSEAAQHGLVSRVVEAEKVLEEAISMAVQIGKRSPFATRLVRELLREASDGPIRQSLRLERLMAYMVFDSEERKERMQKFVDTKKSKGNQ